MPPAARAAPLIHGTQPLCIQEAPGTCVLSDAKTGTTNAELVLNRIRSLQVSRPRGTQALQDDKVFVGIFRNHNLEQVVSASITCAIRSCGVCYDIDGALRARAEDRNHDFLMLPLSRQIRLTTMTGTMRFCRARLVDKRARVVEPSRVAVSQERGHRRRRAAGLDPAGRLTTHADGLTRLLPLQALDIGEDDIGCSPPRRDPAFWLHTTAGVCLLSVSEPLWDRQS